MKLFFLVLLSFLANASTHEQLGTYAGAPEVHDTVAFELLKEGKAIVTTDYFNADGSKNKAATKKLKGTWSYKDPFLTISFGSHKDQLRKEDCPQPHPCFKFEKSYGKNLSPLNVPYGFGYRNSFQDEISK